MQLIDILMGCDLPESACRPTKVISWICSQNMQPAPAARPLRKPIARKHRYPAKQ